jgi:hypothetical protein
MIGKLSGQVKFGCSFDQNVWGCQLASKLRSPVVRDFIGSDIETETKTDQADLFKLKTFEESVREDNGARGIDVE